jgi:hypothetical protein
MLLLFVYSQKTTFTQNKKFKRRLIIFHEEEDIISDIAATNEKGPNE